MDLGPLEKSTPTTLDLMNAKFRQTCQGILEEMDAEENLEDANEKAQAIGSTLCTTETIEKQ